MSITQLHAERRRILNDIKGAEQTGQYALAAHLLSQFQAVNHEVRDMDELNYHPQDVRHDMAMH